MSTPSSETPTADTDTAVAASSWGSELPRANRPRPRAYGTGRYGIDHYDRRDDTRYAWTRVPQAVAVALGFLLSFVAPAAAQNSYCENADAQTSIYRLCLPSIDVEGANPWGSKWNENAEMVEDAIVAVSLTTGVVAARVTALETLASTLGVSTNSLSVQIATLSASTHTLNLTKLSSVTVNASMINPQASASLPLGVNPSSVAVLNAGGFVLPFQIDGSSIAKLNSSGLVPNALIDTSSVAKLNSSGYIPNALLDPSSVTKQGVGISSTCASGQYLQSMVTTGGVVKGGTCVAAGAGDVTSSGSNSFSTPATVQTFGSSVTFSGRTDFEVSPSTWHVGNVTSTNYTSNAMSVCVTGSTRTITAVSSCIQVKFSGSTSNNSGGQFVVSALRNGAFLSGLSASAGMVTGTNAGTDVGHNASFVYWDCTVTRGSSYNYCLLGATNSGTQRLPDNAGAFGTTPGQFGIRSDP